MAFGISAYEQNMAGVNGTNQVKEQVNPVSSVKAANAAALGDAREGAVVTGEVASVRGRTVQLKLPDAQVVTARLEADVKIQVGQSMAFAVKSNTGSQIALTPLFNSSAVNPTAIKALGQASILVNQDTLTMASAMMEEGMPIDRQSMQNMFHIVNGFDSANPADVVAMMKQGIPVNAENLEQFAIYRNNEHQIMGMVDSIADSLTDTVSELPMQGAMELAEVFNPEGEPLVENELRNALVEKANAYEQQLLEESIPVVKEDMVKPAGILDVLRQQESAAEPVDTKEPETAAVVLKAAEADTELGQLLSVSDRENMAAALQKLGVSEETLKGLLEGTMSPQKALTYIQKSVALLQDGLLDKLNFSPEDKADIEHSIKEFAAGETFKKLLKHAVKSELSLKPDGDISQEKIQQLYQKIISDTERASRILENYSKGDSSLAKGLESLKQNVNFMNQLNETFTYVQLPIQLSGENAHGDLYVYTNKKKLLDKDGEVSALLHLELESMGTVDINVHLKDSNKVRMDWTLPNAEIIDLVEANLPMLNKRLADRGYEVSCHVGMAEKEEEGTNKAVTAMLGAKKVPSKGLMSKFSFDVKA